VFIGDFENDKMHGNGVFQYADGSKYEGEFQNDKKHGHGTLLSLKEKFIYEGLFFNGYRHG